MTRDWSLIAVIAYGVSFLIFIGALFVVPRNRKPGEATAWLMLIFLLPYVGLLIFLFIGNPKLSQRRRAEQRRMNQFISDRVSEVEQDPELAPLFTPPLPQRFEPFARLNAALGGMPVCTNNTVELLPDYDDAIKAIADAIADARQYVHVEYFILAMDHTTEPFFVAMEHAVRRGVRVRVLLDHMGSLLYPGRKQMLKRLTGANIEWHWMLPVLPFDNHWNRPDLRNHRKIVVVDGYVAFMGSQNMIDKTYLTRANIKRGLTYVELGVRVTGPCVAELNAAFMTDWYSETHVLLQNRAPLERMTAPASTPPMLCQVLPSGSGYDNDNNLKLFTSLIHAAQLTLTLTNPYFVPDDSLMTAITSAAQRGVDVTLITSEIGDQFFVYHAQHSYYEELMLAGVKIYQYAAPTILHAKHITIDDDIAVIGSSNLDMRSLTLNLEVTLVVYDTRTVADLRQVQADYLRHCKPVHLKEWDARPLHDKLYDNIARLTSTLQ